MTTTLITALLLTQVSASPTYTKAVSKPGGIVEAQTAAQRFTAPGKPDVWLVGVIHIGEKKYYADLQTLLDAQSVVLFEGVKPSAKTPPAPPAGDKAPKPIYKTLSDALSLEFQSNQMVQRSNWVNSDLSWDDLDKLNKEKNGGKPTSFDQVKQVLDPSSAMGQQLVSILSTATPGLKEGIKMILVKSMAGAANKAMDQTMREIVIDARNQSVIDTFAKTIKVDVPPKSIAIFWGAGHMPGLQKQLGDLYGYKTAETKWFPAASADPAKLDATGKMIVEAFEKQSATQKPGGGGGQLPLAALTSLGRK